MAQNPKVITLQRQKQRNLQHISKSTDILHMGTVSNTLGTTQNIAYFRLNKLLYYV